MTPLRVLIIEDDVDLSATLYDFLEAEGHILDAAADGVTGLHLAITQDYDVIVIDINLPGMDGLAVCRKLRKEAAKRTPVIMLTARGTLDDKLAGFDCGADDYLVKPVALQELSARLLAVSWRSANARDGVLQVGDLTYNPGTHAVRRGNREITLTPTCLKILDVLIRNSPNIVSRVQIEAAVWGDSPPDSDSLRVHIHTLRYAIDHLSPYSLIHTVHGIGFRIAGPETPDAP
jgi:DNA-binding response OmpR family regulator